MKAFYKKLIQTLEEGDNKALFVQKDITPPKYIDLFADQYFNPEAFDLFHANAVLVEWDIDHNTAPSLATITAHCCYEQLRFTDNTSKNRELGLLFLDYIRLVDKIIRTIESKNTGKLKLVNEGFQKMDSIVDVYLLTYQCSYTPDQETPTYQDGAYEGLDMDGNLVKKITRPEVVPGVEYGLE